MVHSKYMEPQLTGKRKPKGALDQHRKPAGMDKAEIIEIVEAVGYFACVGIIVVLMFGLA